MSWFSCGCFTFWLEYTPWSGHFPWLDFPSFFFCHLSGSSEVQKKAHFLETFHLAHWGQSFKSAALVLELFIWYLIICDLALLSDCVWVILPRENVSPLRSEWFTFLYTLQNLPSFPLAFPHSCRPSSLLLIQQLFHKLVWLLWTRFLLPPGMCMVPGGRDCIRWFLFGSSMVCWMMDATNFVLLNFISLLFLLFNPLVDFYKYYHSE